MDQRERNQEFFNNFVSAVNGKGRAFNNNTLQCRYKLPDHPGCAVGCQPIFKKVNALFPMPDTDENCTIGQLSCVSEKGCNYSDFRKALSLVLSEDDVKFLASLQRFHDSPSAWMDKHLFFNRVTEFCVSHNLSVPPSLYYVSQ